MTKRGRDVRIGSHNYLELVAGSQKEATQQVGKACNNIPANLILEGYSSTIHSAWHTFFKMAP